MRVHNSTPPLDPNDTMVREPPQSRAKSATRRVLRWTSYFVVARATLNESSSSLHTYAAVAAPATQESRPH